MPLIGVHTFIVADWMRDIMYYLVRIMMHTWFDYHPGETWKESSETAVECAERFTSLLEKNHLYTQCTTNVHSLVHALPDESTVGPMYKRRDFKLERFIMTLKYGIAGKVTFEPEKLQARNYLMYNAILAMEDFCVQNGLELPPGSQMFGSMGAHDHTGITPCPIHSSAY